MLINTLSLLFAFTDYLTELQALGIVVAVGLIVDWFTPRPAEYWELRQSASLYYYLHASWLGQLALKDAFWPFLSYSMPLWFISIIELKKVVLP